MDAHATVDLHRLQSPLAGDGRHAARPDREARRTRHIGVTVGAVNDRPRTARTCRQRGRLATHVGDIQQPLDDHHIARLRQVVGLVLAHLAFAGLRDVQRAARALHIAHRHRLPHHAFERQTGLQDGRRNDPDQPELVHRVRQVARQIFQRRHALNHVGRYALQREPTNRLAGHAPGEFFGAGHACGHGPSVGGLMRPHDRRAPRETADRSLPLNLPYHLGRLRPILFFTELLLGTI